MALVTLEEFQASREAQAAGLSSVDVQDALDDNEALLYELIGYRVDVPDPTRSVADAVTTDNDETLTSATAAFTLTDVGRPISGVGIPSGTTIAARNSATSIEMSEQATATAIGVTITITETDTPVTLAMLGEGKEVLVPVDRIRSLTSLSEWDADLLATDYELIADGFALKRRGYDRNYWSWNAPIAIEGLFGFAQGERRRELAERCLRLMVAKDAGSGLNKAMQGPTGAYLTGYRTETAEFSYFTPEEDPKIVRLLELLHHPLKPKDALYSVQVTGLSQRRDALPRAN
jgi:hypothetical protein